MEAVAGLVVGAGFGAGLLGCIAGLAGSRPSPGRLLARGGRRAHRVARRGVLAVVAGLTVAVVTRWPVAGAAVFASVVWWPTMFGAAAEARMQLVRLEALATWTESLRDTIAGAAGLEQAIPATVEAAPDALAPALHRLAGALRAKVPLTDALIVFAADLDDESADLVVAALILNVQLRGPGLRGTLSALATSTREELDMRRRVEAGRRALRRQVQVILGVSCGFAVFLALFSARFLAPYDTVAGQVMLAVVVAVFGAGFWWMRKLARVGRPRRFLPDPEGFTGSEPGGPAW